MSMVDSQVAPLVPQWLTERSANAPVAVLLRHSARGPLPSGEAGHAVPLTADGVRRARTLGSMLGTSLRTLHTSPLPRCVQTAEALRSGAGVAVPINSDRLLGDPGVYVIDGERAWSNWASLGHEAVIESLVTGRRDLPGMAEPGRAARILLRHMLATAGDRPGLHLFVTHDIVITVTMAKLFGEPLGKKDWPRYLEGAFFWQSEGSTAAAYRDLVNYRPNDSRVYDGSGGVQA